VTTDEAVDYRMDGLTLFLDRCEEPFEHNSEERAKALWNLLSSHLDSVPALARSNFFKGEYKWFYRRQHGPVYFDASFAKLLRTTRWLPAKAGGFFRPEELSFNELPEGFLLNDFLVSELGMRPALIDQVAREHSIEPRLLQYAIRNPQKIAELIDKEGFERPKERSRNGSPGTVDYIGELRQAFAAPGKTQEETKGNPPGPVRNPDLRRERINKEIEEARGREPAPDARFVRVERKIWESKDRSPRTFLREEYQGRCQICDDTFLKRDGEPYFEGVYLVSRKTAKWSERPGNILCLCANCAAKFLHGSVEADEDVLEQIMTLKTLAEGGVLEPSIGIILCGEEARIRYSERHLIDLQETIKVAESNAPAQKDTT
jgi:hypothetical protein